MRGKRRYIILFLIYKNLQLKYKHSALGFLWSLLHPFLYLLIFYVIFSKAMASEIPNYPLYILSGLVFWIYFSGGTSMLSQVFIKNTHLIKSLNIPKTIYPITELGSELVSFLLALIPFLVLMYFTGMHINLTLFCLIPVILLFSVFIFSVGIILGSLNVFFRDVNILWNTLNPALFYATPIVYSESFVPKEYLFILKFNPLYHFMMTIRDVLFLGQAPALHYILRCLLITTVVSIVAFLIYRKTRNGFISNL
jgi:ABC-2 type transport system permease protein